jgi:hypothetical protein
MLLFHKQGGYFNTISKVVQETIGEPFKESNNPKEEGTWVLFFTSFLSGFYKLINSPYILIQTELTDKTFERYPEYKIMHDNAFKVLDFSKNLDFKYSDVYRMESELSKEIDVLFYGVLSDRRKKILDQINCKKVILSKSPPIFGPELWKYINNSKIVVNISCYDNRYEPDWIRLSPLLSNKIFVITETVGDTSFNSLKEYIPICEYEYIPTLIKHFLNSPLNRIKWADRGFDFIRQHKTKIIE